MLVNLEHSENAPSPICVTESGIITLVSFESGSENSETGRKTPLQIILVPSLILYDSMFGTNSSFCPSLV